MKDVKQKFFYIVDKLKLSYFYISQLIIPVLVVLFLVLYYVKEYKPKYWNKYMPRQIVNLGKTDPNDKNLRHILLSDAVENGNFDKYDKYMDVKHKQAKQMLKTFGIDMDSRKPSSENNCDHTQIINELKTINARLNRLEKSL